MMTKEFTRSASNENTYFHPLPDPAILPAANRRAWPAIYVSRPCGALDSAGDEHRYKMNTPFPIEIAEAIFWFHVVVIAFAVLGLVAIPLGAWAAGSLSEFSGGEPCILDFCASSPCKPYWGEPAS